MGRGRRLARPWIMLGEIAWAAPQVIALRTARVVRGGVPPTPRTRRELERMVSEKVTAVARGGAAAVLAVPLGAADVAAAALGPVHRTVAANRRRLRR